MSAGVPEGSAPGSLKSERATHYDHLYIHFLPRLSLSLIMYAVLRFILRRVAEALAQRTPPGGLGVDRC